MALTSGERTTTAGVIWNSLLSGFGTAGSVGKKLADWVLGTDNRVKVSADVHTSGQTVAAVSGAVGGVTAGVTVSTNLDKTGYSLASGVTVTTIYDKTGYSLVPGSTVTTLINQDKTGYALSASGLAAVAAPSDINTDTEARATFMSMMRALFNRFHDRVDQTNARQTIYNDSGTAVSTRNTSDDGTTQTIGKTE